MLSHDPARGDSNEWSRAFTRREPVETQAAPHVLIGRSDDCRALDELVEAIRQGLSRSLVILGEPGIGKTRLLEYAAQAADGVRMVRIAGLESELRLGFAALHRMLVPFLDRVGQLPAPQREALDSAFGRAAGPPADRFLVSMSVLTLLAEIAAEQPLIWLVDDAHWLDRESVEVLGFVGRRLHADRTGLLFCAREASPGLAALAGLPTRQVSGLEPAAARALLAATVSGPLNARVAARIIRETGGNPLALRELAQHLTPDQLAGRSPLPERLPVGRRLQGHFLGQAKMLPPATGTWLLLASAASGSDPAALWRAAALLGLEPDAADPAVAQDIVSVAPRVAFRHPLIRSAVYEGAPPGERRQAHEALASIAGQDGHPDEAAWHRAAASSCGRCSACAARRRPGPVRPSASRRGRTRTTPTAGSPGCGFGSTRFPRSRRRSGQGWPRRWRAPPTNCAMMRRCWRKSFVMNGPLVPATATFPPWQRTCQRARRRRPTACPPSRWPGCRARCAVGCCARRRWRRAARPAR